MAGQRRIFQMAERIRQVVAMEILQLSDPRLALVTVTSVSVTKDLREAKIYWVVSGDEERKREVKEGLKSAENYLKRTLGKELGVRFMPSLKFFYDDTSDVMEQVGRLFDKVSQQSQK